MRQERVDYLEEEEENDEGLNAENSEEKKEDVDEDALDSGEAESDGLDLQFVSELIWKVGKVVILFR